MTIETELQQDVFEAVDTYLSEGREIVFMHGCNAQGVMGAGVAKKVREQWPSAFETYQKYVDGKAIKNLLGSTVHAYPEDGLCIVNAITQENYGRDGKYADLDAIAECLRSVEYKLGSNQDTKYMSVRIGCGLGGLEWSDVKLKYNDSIIDWEIYYL